MMGLENMTEKRDCPRDNAAGALSRLCMTEPRPSVLDPFAANSWAVVEICRISLCLRNRDKQRRFRSAQPEGDPEEAEDEDEQSGSFQGGWSGWVETSVVRLQNAGTGSLTGVSGLLILLLPVVDFGLCGWSCRN